MPSDTPPARLGSLQAGLVWVGLELAAGHCLWATTTTGQYNWAGSGAGTPKRLGVCLGRIRPRTSDQISGSPWGVSCHWIADKHELSVEQQLDRLAWLGAKWAFLCPDWDRIETEKDHYHWNSPAHRLDDVVAGLVKRGIAPVMQIYGGNRLYMPFVPDPTTGRWPTPPNCSTTPGSEEHGIASWRPWLPAIVGT